MKILAVNWRDPQNPLGGGAEVHLWENLKRLVNKGHSVLLVSVFFKGAKRTDIIDGIEIIRCGREWNFNYIAPFVIRKLIRKRKFDIVLEDINKIPFYTPLYVDIPIMGIVPHIFGKTIFYQTNFIFASYVYLWEKPLKYVYRDVPFLVISPSTKYDMIKRGFPEDNINVVFCGIDHNKYYYDKSIKRFDKPTILYVGRLKKYKSVQHLIKAFEYVKEKIPHAQLIIVGEGDYKKELKQLALASRYKEDILFTGFVSEEEKLNYIRKSHVSVYPSLIEGWGLVNIEAAACGTPVIASRVPGLRDSVKDGETGFLYEYGNVEELGYKLVQLLKSVEDGKFEQFVNNSLKWASLYQWDVSANEMEKMLYNTINRRFYGDSYSS